MSRNYLNGCICLFVVFSLALEVFADPKKTNLLEMVDIEGEIRFRYFNYKRLNDRVESEYVNLGPFYYTSQRSLVQRALIGANIHINDQLKGKFSIVHNNYWGNNLKPGRVSEAYHTPDLPNSFLRRVFHSDNSFLVSEAYGLWSPIDELSLRGGRGPLDLHDGLVISSNDFETFPITFDHILASYNKKTFKVNLWYAELANVIDESNKSQQVGLFGLSVDLFNISKIFDMANVYLMHLKIDPMEFEYGSRTRHVRETSEFRYGLFISREPKSTQFDYKVSISGHSGTEKLDEVVIIEGFMVDLKAGFSFPTSNLRVFAGLHMDSGDSDNDRSNGSQRYRSFFYNFHENAGEMDIFQWGNLTYFNAGFTIDPIKDLTLGLSYFLFQATEENDAFHSLAGSSYGLSSNLLHKGEEKGSDKMGSEADIWVHKNCGKNLDFSLVYSMFFPGDFYLKVDRESRYNSSFRVFLQALLKF